MFITENYCPLPSIQFWAVPSPEFWDERTSAQMRLRKKGISKLQIYLSLPLGLGQLKNKSVCL